MPVVPERPSPDHDLMREVAAAREEYLAMQRRWDIVYRKARYRETWPKLLPAFRESANFGRCTPL